MNSAEVLPDSEEPMRKTKRIKKNEIAGQMLDIMDVCSITGLSKTCVTQLIHAEKLKAIQIVRRYMIPGAVLLEYMKTPEYAWTKKKSGCYKKTADQEVTANE